MKQLFLLEREPGPMGAWIFNRFSGPEGTEWWHDNPSNFLVQNVNHMSLVGKIGENGTPFGIGNHNKVQAVVGGTIFLAMNDRPGSFSDNYGYLVVAVYRNPITDVHENEKSQSPTESTRSPELP